MGRSKAVRFAPAKSNTVLFPREVSRRPDRVNNPVDSLHKLATNVLYATTLGLGAYHSLFCAPRLGRVGIGLIYPNLPFDTAVCLLNTIERQLPELVFPFRVGLKVYRTCWRGRYQQQSKALGAQR